MRGYSAIGLINPKTESNLGSVLRAAHCYGAGLVMVSGKRMKPSAATNTPQAQRHLPLLFADPLDNLPHGCVPVAVDLIAGAKPLPEFTHPERAIYIFGPEDGTLDKAITDRCAHIVYIPTKGCMNLAACVNVVLYDRLMKRGIS